MGGKGQDDTTTIGYGIDGATSAASDGQNGSQAPADAALIGVDLREERLFRALDDDNDQAVRLRDFERVFAEVGLKSHDKRLHDSLGLLKQRIETARQVTDEITLKISRADFY